MRKNVTQANAVSETKKSFRKFDFRFALKTNVRRKRASDDETKNIAGRIPETTRIVVQNNFYPKLVKIRTSKKTLEITETVDQYNIKSIKTFSVQGCG